jgi:hypothetical protein
MVLVVAFALVGEYQFEFAIDDGVMLRLQFSVGLDVESDTMLKVGQLVVVVVQRSGHTMTIF